MSHLFRPADPSDGRPLPQWKMWRGLLYVTALQLLARAGGLFRSRPISVALHTALIVAGMVVQVVLLLMVAYMVDLAISLMELWAELARKHLELTLS